MTEQDKLCEDKSESTSAETAILANKLSEFAISPDTIPFPQLNEEEEKAIINMWLLGDPNIQDTFFEVLGPITAKVVIDNAETVAEVTDILVGLMEKPKIMEKAKEFATEWVKSLTENK